MLSWAISFALATAGPSTSPRAVQADLDALHRGLEQAHYDLYAHRTRAEYDQLYKVLSER